MEEPSPNLHSSPVRRQAVNLDQKLAEIRNDIKTSEMTAKVILERLKRIFKKDDQ